MQVALSDDQALFRDTTVRFIEAELPLARTRELHDDPRGYDRGWLRKSAELGWFSVLVPENLGGGSVSGAGLLDAALIAEELGRHVQPGPFIPMNVVAGALAAHGSDAHRDRLVPALVAGEAVATWAFADDRGTWDGGAGLRAERSADGGLVLQGTRGFVQDAQSADVLLVVVDLDGSPVQATVAADAAGVTVRPLRTLDLSRRMAHVDLDGVRVEVDALLGGGAEALEAQLDQALTLACAEAVGALDALLTMTVQYAKDRVAFGRPIGSFQAIKHILADQLLYLETCKAVAVAAAEAVQRGDEDASVAASMAAAYVGDVGNDIAQECLQVHGGIGYTWEHDLHLLLRRVRADAALYGEPSWHRERVCARSGLGANR